MQKEAALISSYQTPKVWISIFWKWVVPLVVLGVIAFMVFDQGIEFYFDRSAMLANLHWLLFCLALLPLNFLIEAQKWRLLVGPFQPTSLIQSLKIVLSGRSLDTFVPLGFGDVFSRIIHVQSADRKQALGALALARGTQMLPTLAFGFMAVIFIIDHGVNEVAHLMYYTLGLTFLLLVSFFVFKNRALKRPDIKQYIKTFSTLSFKKIFILFSLSFFRYFVFAIQFMSIFYWLGWSFGFQILAFGVCWIFLIKSVVPDLSIFGDLVKRELSAVAFFSLFGIHLDIVILASFMVWVINIVLPAVAGLWFVPEIKKQLT